MHFFSSHDCGATSISFSHGHLFLLTIFLRLRNAASSTRLFLPFFFLFFHFCPRAREKWEDTFSLLSGSCLFTSPCTLYNRQKKVRRQPFQALQARAGVSKRSWNSPKRDREWAVHSPIHRDLHSNPHELTKLLKAYSSKTIGLLGTPYCSNFRPTFWKEFLLVAHSLNN